MCNWKTRSCWQYIVHTCRIYSYRAQDGGDAEKAENKLKKEEKKIYVRTNSCLSRTKNNKWFGADKWVLLPITTSSRHRPIRADEANQDTYERLRPIKWSIAGANGSSTRAIQVRIVIGSDHVRIHRIRNGYSAGNFDQQRKLYIAFRRQFMTFRNSIYRLDADSKNTTNRTNCTNSNLSNCVKIENKDSNLVRYRRTHTGRSKPDDKQLKTEWRLFFSFSPFCWHKCCVSRAYAAQLDWSKLNLRALRNIERSISAYNLSSSIIIVRYIWHAPLLLIIKSKWYVLMTKLSAWIVSKFCAFDPWPTGQSCENIKTFHIRSSWLNCNWRNEKFENMTVVSDDRNASVAMHFFPFLP